MALFDSGSSVGAAIAPALVLFLVGHFGGWRPAFVVTGLLGFAWVVVWRSSYHPPDTHPRVTPGERAMLLADRAAEQAESPEDHGRPVAVVRSCCGCARRGASSRRAVSPTPSGS